MSYLKMSNILEKTTAKEHLAEGLMEEQFTRIQDMALLQDWQQLQVRIGKVIQVHKP